ncbi:2339_t:CDS:2, partial [Entrophospora sp. SA101]
QPRDAEVDETRQKEKLKEKELDKLDVTNINEKLNNENDGWDNTGKHANDLVDDGDEAELDKLDTKRGPYMKGKIPKSTYYDKFGPNGMFTKAAAGTKKITSFFKNNNDAQEGILSDIEEEFSSDPEDEVCQINEKIQKLKDELEKQHSKMTVVEYNWKRAIYEYLTLSNNNNGCRKISDSLEAAKKVFIDGGVWKATRI